MDTNVYPRGRLAMAILALLAGSVAAEPAGFAPERQSELVRLVREDCGSCHGLRLTGGLGPPLTPEALQDRPRQALVRTILEGRPGTPMPPWKGFLSEPEAAWIVERLQKGFPDVRPDIH